MTDEYGYEKICSKYIRERYGKYVNDEFICFKCLGFTPDCNTCLNKKYDKEFVKGFYCKEDRSPHAKIAWKKNGVNCPQYERKEG